SRAFGYLARTVRSAASIIFKSANPLRFPDQPMIGESPKGLAVSGAKRFVSTAVGRIIMFAFHWRKYSAKKEFPQITESEMAANLRANELPRFSQIASSTSRTRGRFVKGSRVRKVESISRWRRVTS